VTGNVKFLWTALKMLKAAAAYWNEYKKALVFCCGCVPEKVRTNEKSVNKKWYFHKNNAVGKV